MSTLLELPVLAEPPAKPAASAAHVVLQGIGKSYHRRGAAPVPALVDIDLTVRRDEFLCLVGPSGCGKSTLLKIVAELIPPTRGALERRPRLPGIDVVPPVGIVFQTPVLFPWKTVLANVMFPAVIQKHDRAQARDRAHRLLALVGLSDMASAHPHQLSGGMQQRAAICRALMCDSDILLMDEPFGALDAMTRDELAVELKSICRHERRTVIFVTHSIPEAVFLGDRIVVMSARPGRIHSVVEIDIERTSDLAVMESVRFQRLVSDIRSRIVR
jgi:NitT/TauT family transport system ATP-binding protein